VNRSPTVWYAIDVTAADEASEAIEYGLMEAGALGTETKDGDDAASLSVIGYFARPPDVATVRDNLVDALRIYNFAPSAIVDLKVREVPERDWLAEWKKDWQPVQVGRFTIAPPWLSEPPAVAGGPFADRITILINPGMAFGTGTHETTRLCLRAIEKYFRGGSFLDVGTGTGILAIAAARAFPEARIEVCDTDAEAIEIAKENAQLNDVADRIQFRVGSVDERTASADLVCANLTAPVIVELLPLLLGITCGRLVLSGILDSQVEMVQSRLSELSAGPLEIDQDGEWVALTI
jgi:ribosomal protein L11 methyltransferase